MKPPQIKKESEAGSGLKIIFVHLRFAILAIRKFFIQFLPFQWQMLSIWREPVRSLRRAKSSNYLIYDHSRRRFRRRLTFWQSLFRRSYFRVYFNEQHRVIGSKLIGRFLFFPLVFHFERILRDGDFLLRQEQKKWESFHHFFPISPFVPVVEQGAFPHPHPDSYTQIALWEMLLRFYPDRKKNQTLFYYRSGETVLEFLSDYKIRGLQVTGDNFKAEESLELSRYVKKYYTLQGMCIGYDEVFNNQFRSSLQILLNEDSVISTTTRTTINKNKKVLKEVGYFDATGKKVSAELFEGDKLSKSAYFVYNEDQKLVSIIQYGPDGDVLSL